MIPRAYSIIGIAVSALLILINFYLLRKGKMQGRGFVLWLMVALVLGLFSGVTPLFELISIVFGTENVVNAIVAAGFLFFLLTAFYLYYRLTEIHSLLMRLAIEISAKKYSENKGQENQRDQTPEDQ